MIAAARKALRANGRLLFALERTADDSSSYQIQVLGRYSRGRAYIERALTDNVFSSMEMTPVLLRYEAGQEVNGWLVNAQV